MDLDGVFATVVASLDRATTRESLRSFAERLVTGWRGGHSLDVSCAHHQRASGSSYDWHVVARVEEGPPIVVRLSRRGPNDAEAEARGDLVIAPTGDTAFDEAWTIEGAPRSLVARVFGPRVRDAVTKLAATSIQLGPSDAAWGEGAVHVELGKVEISSFSGPFDAGTVLRGIDLAVALCDELAALRDERRRAPLTPEALAGEEAEVTAARAARPKDVELRVWRRMSTRTRALVIAGAVVVGIYTLFDWGREALSFLHVH